MNAVSSAVRWVSESSECRGTGQVRVPAQAYEVARQVVSAATLHIVALNEAGPAALAVLGAGFAADSRVVWLGSEADRRRLKQSGLKGGITAAMPRRGESAALLRAAAAYSEGASGVVAWGAGAVESAQVLTEAGSRSSGSASDSNRSVTGTVVVWSALHAPAVPCGWKRVCADHHVRPPFAWADDGAAKRHALRQELQLEDNTLAVVLAGEPAPLCDALPAFTATVRAASAGASIRLFVSSVSASILTAHRLARAAGVESVLSVTPAAADVIGNCWAFDAAIYVGAGSSVQARGLEAPSLLPLHWLRDAGCDLLCARDAASVATWPGRGGASFVKFHEPGDVNAMACQLLDLWKQMGNRHRGRSTERADQSRAADQMVAHQQVAGDSALERSVASNHACAKFVRALETDACATQTSSASGCGADPS